MITCTHPPPVSSFFLLPSPQSANSGTESTLCGHTQLSTMFYPMSNLVVSVNLEYHSGKVEHESPVA